MSMECGHIVQERAIFIADAPVEVCGQNVRSIMCVWSMVTLSRREPSSLLTPLKRYVVKMSGPSCVNIVWLHSPGESYPHC